MPFVIPPMKVSELAAILDTPNTFSSRALKAQPPEHLTFTNQRLTGASPEAVEAVLRKEGHSNLYRPTIIAIATNVGGASKTSTSVNLLAAMRRFTARTTAQVLIDLDSQASATQQLLGLPIPDNRPVLDDYFDNKCSSINELLTPVGNPEDNMFILGSNLNNLFLDRRFPTGSKIRDGIYRLVGEIFDKLGPQTCILFDTGPQLSSATQSVICCLGRCGDDTIKSFLIPLRCDAFSLRGASICLSELEDTLSSYKDVTRIPVSAFFSMYDSRVKISVEIMKQALKHDSIGAIISDKVVRYSSEIAKSALASENVFSSGKRSPATDDYTDLALSILGYKGRR